MSITLYGVDVEGDALSYVVVTPPAHGQLSGDGPNLVYTPAPNYNGPDGFTFKVSDGAADSAETTVGIAVRAVNDAPVAVGDSRTIQRNSSAAVTVLANDRDDDGDALTVVSVTQGSNGSVSIAPGGKSVTYTPRRNFTGNDTFVYFVSDGRGGTASAYVTMTVRK